MARVSAVIPTYNRPEFIEDAVESVLNQTYEDIEAIVVDDSPNDKTRDILEQYDEDDRVNAIHTGEKQGIAAARNQGIEASRGEFIGVLDDDDRWHPEKIEKQVELMDLLGEEYGVVYTWGQVQRGQNGEITERYENKRSGDIYPEVLGSFKMMPYSSHLIRESALEVIGGYDSRFELASDDWDCAIRLARNYRYDVIPEVLVTSTVHGGNTIERPVNAIGDEMILRKYREEASQYPEVETELLGLVYQSMATAAFQRGDSRDAFRYSWSALRHEPTSWRAQLALMSCFGTRGRYAAQRARQVVVDRM